MAAAESFDKINGYGVPNDCEVKGRSICIEGLINLVALGSVPWLSSNSIVSGTLLSEQIYMQLRHAIVTGEPRPDLGDP
jgi:hypothetical protein